MATRAASGGINYNAEGYRSLMDVAVRAPSCHRRYKNRPAVVKVGMAEDPCIDLWSSVVDCYAKHNYAEAPCVPLYRSWHECYQLAGPKKERIKQRVNGRFHVKQLVDRQRNIASDPTATGL